MNLGVFRCSGTSDAKNSKGTNNRDAHDCWNLVELFPSRRSCLRICALRFCGLTMAAWRSSGQVARGEGESDIFLIRRYEYTRARGIWYEGGRFACHSRTSVTCEWGKLAVPTSPPEARSKKSSTPGARTHAKPTKGQKRTTWGTHTVARRPPMRAAKGFPRRKS